LKGAIFYMLIVIGALFLLAQALLFISQRMAEVIHP